MTLLQVVIIIPLVTVLVTMTATIVRNIARAWLDHHVKLELLSRLERQPQLLKSYDELQHLLDTSPGDEDDQGRLDFLLTGSILAGIGLICALLGVLFSGRQAVGIYIGGVICVVLGFVLAMVGLATRFLARAPSPKRSGPWWRRRRSDKDGE